MGMDIIRLIREAVAQATATSSLGRAVDQHYIPRERAISLCLKYLKFIAPAVSRFLFLKSEEKSKPQEIGESHIFYRLRLKFANIEDAVNIGDFVSVKTHKSRFTFQDHAGNYYVKLGAPLSVHMRVRNGKGKVLTSEPYEMRENDEFTFRGKVVKTRTTARGTVINYIDGIQPV